MLTPEAVAVFEDLVRWRRDVRRFTDAPVSGELIDKILDVADLAPSVGNSQPWRVVEVRDAERRTAIRRNFEACNRDAANRYPTERALEYTQLKLAGFDRAPVHLAVFCDELTDQGSQLGRNTMPETLAYSCVSYMTTMWLSARSHGLGLGWVSILNPEDARTVLGVPAGWKFIGYLLLGWPEEPHTEPELQRAGWQSRTPASARRTVR
jgi:5,6-dimethylbenzimidazole synthase